jgi:hypothetical protein
MKTIQMRKAGAARGHYWGLQSAKAEGLSDRNTFFIYATDERGSGLEENVRLCSPMFAYVRLIREKLLRPLGAAIADCKMHEMMNWRSRCGMAVGRTNPDLLKAIKGY